MTSKGYDITLPLETIIGYFTSSIEVPSRNSLQNSNGGQSIRKQSSSSNLSNDSPTSSGSPGANQSSSSSGNDYSLGELRSNFEEFLVKRVKHKANIAVVQKLKFLDLFFDTKRRRVTNFTSTKQVYHSANQFIYELIKNHARPGLIQEIEQETYFPYLKQFDSIVEDYSYAIPLFSQHEYVNSWFGKIQEQVKNSSPTSTEEEFQDRQLNILVQMFYSQLKGLFFYYQKEESKYCKKWLEINLSTLPTHLLENIKNRFEKNQKFQDLLLYKEEDLKFNTIIDTDFEFLEHLAENSGDWKRSKHSEFDLIHVFSLIPNFTAVPNTKTYKYVYAVPQSINQFAKEFLQYDTSEHYDNIKMSECKHYQALDTSHSSRKYSTILRSYEMGAGLFSKRSYNDIVTTTKAKFIGDELVEATFLYKSCNIDDSNQKTKHITLGGVIMVKEDTNVTRVIEIAMFTVSGASIIKNHVKFLTSILDKIKDSRLKKTEEELNSMPTWKSFCDYCREYYKIDANKL